MELALVDAGLEPRRRRATSTPTAPRPRSTTWPRPRAINKVFGEPGPPVTSNKGVHRARPRRGRGHRGRGLGADHRPRLIPPTAGYEELDPEIHLDVVHGDARPWEPGPVLSNSFGFGGHNGCLVIAPRLSPSAGSPGSRATSPDSRAGGVGSGSGVEGPAQLAHELCRRFGPAALEQPAHEGGADDDPVGDPAGLGGLLGGRDPDPHAGGRVGAVPDALDDPGGLVRRASIAPRSPPSGPPRRRSPATWQHSARARAGGVEGATSSTVPRPPRRPPRPRARAPRGGGRAGWRPARRPRPASAPSGGGPPGRPGCSRSSRRAGRRRRCPATTSRACCVVSRARGPAAEPPGSPGRRSSGRRRGSPTSIGVGPGGGHRLDDGRPVGEPSRHHVGDEELAAALPHRPEGRLELPGRLGLR